MVISAFLLSAGFAFALEVDYPSFFGFSINPDETSLPDYAKYFFNFGIGIAGILAVCVLVFGGVYYMLSAARGSFKDESKEWIKAGILGLTLTLSSYLIAYTINPDLVVFRLRGLQIVSLWDTSTKGIESTAKKVYYKEIPIGMLTEQLLAQQIDCFDFNATGDPVGEQKTDSSGGKTDFIMPYHRENMGTQIDITECLQKVTDAASKKMNVTEKLANKILEMMQQCQCSGSACNVPEQNWSGTCPPIFLAGQSCPNDTCTGNAKCEISSGGGSVCPPGYLESIKGEGDPIKINACCDSSADICTEKGYKGLKEFKSGDQFPIEDSEGNINITNWHKLTIYDQLNYLKQKVEFLKNTIKANSTKLKEAESKVNSCYFAKSYADFLKISEQTNKTDTVIMKVPTGGAINKYCSGFEYANSHIYSVCQNICPGNGQKDLQCYDNCEKCDNESLQCAKYDPVKEKDAYQNCLVRRQSCLDDQSRCVKNCWNNRSCIFDVFDTKNTRPAKDDEKIEGFKTFPDCMVYYKNKCLEDCKNTSPCPDDYKKCANLCNIDSQCLLNYEDACVIGASNLAKCNTKSNLQDASNLKNCIDKASLCFYGSDQYAGYEQCLKPSAVGNDFSSSFLYRNQNLQRCKTYFTNTSTTGLEYCGDRYPETSKCPGSSDCPYCPCGIVGDYNYETTTPSTTSVTKPDSATVTAGGNSSTYYQVVTSKCAKYSYNDDALTFYCMDSWWQDNTEKREEPVGNTRYCSKKSEIPVGDTVDSAEEWADNFVEEIDKYLKKLSDAMAEMEKIANEKDYCKCDSTCGDGKNACMAECLCSDTEQSTTDETTGETTTTSGCACSRSACLGNPCQKIMNMLAGKAAQDKCPEGTEYKGIAAFVLEVKDAKTELDKFITSDKKSDLIKKLTYSRETISKCGVITTGYGSEVKNLSCQRAMDEITPPVKPNEGTKTIINSEYIDGYCYGSWAGNITSSDSLMDNWFCCEKWETEEENGGGIF